MNILLLTSALPFPAISGGALRVLSLIRALDSLGHSVSILAYGDPTVNWRSTPLGTLCRDVHVCSQPVRTRSQRITALLRGHADIADRLASDAYAELLRTLLTDTRYDIVQAEGIEMAWTLPLVQQFSPIAKRVFDTFNAEYQLQRVIARIDASEFRRWPLAAYSWIQSRRIAAFERAMMMMSDLVIAVSQEDAGALGKLDAGRPIAVVPSAIDTSRYADIEPEPTTQGNTIVFTGKMDYRPNVDAAIWFANAILPLVRTRVADARFLIIGQQPHARVERLGSLPGVTVTGFVPDVAPYLAASAVYAAPLRMGSGTRLKLLEAMAAGCAIVSTSLGASGLTDEARSSMLVADEASKFADHVASLLTDPASVDHLRSRAKSAVDSTYSWQAIGETLARAYQEAGIE